MKKWLPLLLSGLILSSTALYADYNLEDASAIEMASEEDQTIFNLKGEGDYIFKAKLKDHTPGHIRFAHALAELETVVWASQEGKDGLKIGLGYEYTRLDWSQNFYFNKKNYNVAFLSLTYFTSNLSDWRWLLSATLDVDADKWNFNDYATYDLLLWGRYQYCQDLGIHVGLYAETGMKLDLILPVLGFDWKIDEQWFLSAVFPFNMTLDYNIDQNWILSLAGRVFSDRNRAGKQGAYEKATWRYSTAGTELALKYKLCESLTANLHGGYAFGGRLRIASRHGQHSHREHFRAAPYAGAEIALNF